MCDREKFAWVKGGFVWHHFIREGGKKTKAGWRWRCGQWVWSYSAKMWCGKVWRSFSHSLNLSQISHLFIRYHDLPQSCHDSSTGCQDSSFRTSHQSTFDENLNDKEESFSPPPPPPSPSSSLTPSPTPSPSPHTADVAIWSGLSPVQREIITRTAAFTAIHVCVCVCVCLSLCILTPHRTGGRSGGFIERETSTQFSLLFSLSLLSSFLSLSLSR